MAESSVILHTDIGTDIDDTWALAMLTLLHGKNLRLVLTDTGDVRYRAALAAKTLAALGCDRTEIGLGCGGDTSKRCCSSLAAWLDGGELKRYPGPVSGDGVARLVELVMHSPEPVKLISIGPAPALAAALEIEPRIAGKIDFTGMFGSLALAAEGRPGAIVEYNVLCDIPAARKVFEAPWRSARLTPLDSCGQIRLRGELFRRIADSKAPQLRPVLDSYREWRKFNGYAPDPSESSILFDTVAVHLAYHTNFLQMERIRLVVDEEGYTRRDAAGRPFDVAVGWRDLPGYERYLVSVLTETPNNQSGGLSCVDNECISSR